MTDKTLDDHAAAVERVRDGVEEDKASWPVPCLDCIKMLAAYDAEHEARVKAEERCIEIEKQREYWCMRVRLGKELEEPTDDQ